MTHEKKRNDDRDESNAFGDAADQNVSVEAEIDVSIQSTKFLPVAAVYHSLEQYRESIFKARFLGNILGDVVELPDRSLIVGSSNLDSSYNAGFVTTFDDADRLRAKQAKLFLNPQYGPCGTMVALNRGDNKDPEQRLIIAGFDSGNLLAIVPDSLQIVQNKCYSHNILTAAAVPEEVSTPRTIATADLDGRLVIIDVENFDAIHMFDYAHNGTINDVRFHPIAGDQSTLLTCGDDHRILLWDLRAKKSTTIATSTTQPIAMCWIREHELIFGTEAGNAVQFDLRSPGRTIGTQSIFADHAIRRIVPINGGDHSKRKSNIFVAFLGENCSQMSIYDRSLRTARHVERYAAGIEIRAVIEIERSKPKEDDEEGEKEDHLQEVVKTNDEKVEKRKTKKVKSDKLLLAIGSDQSVFVHDHILDRLHLQET